MRRFATPIRPNSFYGHTILEELPNTFGEDPTPLFIREAVQNSLDAHDEINVTVSIELKLRKVPADVLNSVFEKAGFSTDKEHFFLEFSDFGTYGLDGALQEPESLDDMGRFWRFALSMGVPQANDDAGGSWGMGKSIYHLMGSGFIIIYSQTKKENLSRLCAKWIVDERDTERAYLRDVGTGIAFWGSKENVPLTDINEIRPTLSNLGLSIRNEPGTSIFIHLDHDPEKYGFNDLKEFEQNFLRHCYQEVYRWYVIRLGDNFKHKLTIRNLPYHYKRSFERNPSFYLFRNLFETAYGYLKQDESESKDDSDIKIVPLKIKNKNITAVLVYRDLTRSELLMQAPDNFKSPVEYLMNNTSQESRSVCGMTRAAGMIVKYDSALLPEPGNPDEYRIGLLLINPECELKKPGSRSQYINAESYFRGCEGKDHSGWDDSLWSKIRKFREQSNYARMLFREIKNLFKDHDGTQKIDVSRDIAQGRIAGDLILGAFGFGHSGHAQSPDYSEHSPNGGSSGGTKSSIKEVKIHMIPKEGIIVFLVDLEVAKNQPLLLQSVAKVEKKYLTRRSWTEQFDINPPWNEAYDGLVNDRYNMTDKIVATDDGIKIPAGKRMELSILIRVESSDTRIKLGIKDLLL
ncbi:hypothetical protein [Salinispira pacifica]|uniref:Uncharacterized protein n=1 Tax=Salinispira pacifica TaxID=1307761 RepID=V5WEX6_9SPIO|nr:hypothetical protein [Salinispira pacifica]AHC14089.1 hypothetical protein L21SP2_0660 [Salinispira pacifica]